MEQRPANTLTSRQSHSLLPLPPSPPLSPLPLSPITMPVPQSSSFEPSPFTLPTLTSRPTLSPLSASVSTTVRRSPRRKRDSDADATATDDAERKRRRQEQNRRAAATSRVNNKLKRGRLEQQVTELEEANERLKRLRQTLADDNTTLASSTTSSALPSSSRHRVRRSSSRESAVLVRSLPWNPLQLIHNKPNIQRAIAAIVALSLLLILCTAVLVVLISSLTAQSTPTLSRHPHRPLCQPSNPSSLSLLPPLLLSSLLSLSAAPLLHFSPSQPFPPLRPASRSFHLLTPPHGLPVVRVNSQRRRLIVSRTNTASVSVGPTATLSTDRVREGISAEALAGVQLRAGQSVAERVWTRGGVRFQPQLRGTNASVSINARVGSPPWLLAVLMMTAMVS